jgi:hypothetical protein
MLISERELKHIRFKRLYPFNKVISADTDYEVIVCTMSFIEIEK